MSGPRFILFGSLTFDNVFTADGTMTPQTYGGNVVYAALGARLWHDSIGVVSRAGADFPETFLKALAEAGIDIKGITRIGMQHRMNVAFCYYPDGSRDRAFPPEIMRRIPEAEQERFIDYTTLGRDARFKTWMDFAPEPRDIPRPWLESYQGVHLAAMPVQRHLALAGFLRNKRPGGTIQVDSPWYDEREPDRDFHSDLFKDIDIILPSEADLRIPMPDLDPLAAGRRLSEYGASTVVVKQGGAGCTVIDGRRHRITSLPVFDTRVVDPTGAGDAFCGGFLVGFVETGDPVYAAAYGTVSASFAIENLGSLPLRNVTSKEAYQRLQLFWKSAGFGRSQSRG